MLNRQQRGPVLPRVFPAFYNWARFPSGGASHLVSHGHQAIDARLYGLFLRNALLFTQGHFAPAAQFVFLESWNGWLDGSQIEPGLLDGDLVLNATRAAIESARYELRTRHAGPADGLPDGLVERINLLCEAARYAAHST